MYMNRYLQGLLCLLLWLGLMACEETQQSDAAGDEDTMVEVPDSSTSTRAMAPAAERIPQLIGKWQLQEMWVGNSQMSVGDVGETFVEFKSNGRVISTAPNMSPDSSQFLYSPEAKRVEAQALQGEQVIKTLNEEKLVLSYQVDGEEVRSVYTRTP